MALQGPFVVVADSPGAGVVGALRAAGAFPIVETSWAEAAAAVASVDPEGLVLANTCSEDVSFGALAAALQQRSSTTSSAFLPVVARTREDGVIVLPDALAIAPNMPAERIVGRLSSALGTAPGPRGQEPAARGGHTRAARGGGAAQAPAGRALPARPAVSPRCSEAVGLAAPAEVPAAARHSGRSRASTGTRSM